MTCLFFRVRPLGVLLAALGSSLLQAQSLPSAGQVMRDIERTLLPLPPRQELNINLPDSGDATAPAGGQPIDVRAFHFTGNTVVSNGKLNSLLADLAGSELTLAELQAAAHRITLLYRELGYPLARAWLPRQEIDDGTLNIDVLEGRYGEIRIENRSRLHTFALAPLHNLQPGDPVRAAPLEQSLLLTRDLAGVDIRSTLQPGASVGATDLVVEVLPGPLAGGSIEMDSYGSRYTGEYRLGGTFNLNNLLRLGDQLSLRFLGSDERQRYGRLGWQLGLGSWGTQLGAGYSTMHYELGRDFTVLDASGRANVASVWAMQSLVRSRDFSLSLALQLDDKRLDDWIDVSASHSERRAQVWSVALSGNGADDWGGGGLSSFTLTWNNGRLTLDDPAGRILDAVTARTHGRFNKLNVRALRLQRLGGPFSLLAQVEGQWANRNLDSSEKMALGGIYGVRAYPQGDTSGDQGWLMRMELRYAAAPGWQLAAFADHGEVTLSHDQWDTGTNRRHLSGAGLGVNWSSGGWEAKANIAWEIGGDSARGPERDPRLWVQATRSF